MEYFCHNLISNREHFDDVPSWKYQRCFKKHMKLISIIFQWYLNLYMCSLFMCLIASSFVTATLWLPSPWPWKFKIIEQDFVIFWVNNCMTQHIEQLQFMVDWYVELLCGPPMCLLRSIITGIWCQVTSGRSSSFFIYFASFGQLGNFCVLLSIGNIYKVISVVFWGLLFQGYDSTSKITTISFLFLEHHIPTIGHDQTYLPL